MTCLTAMLSRLDGLNQDVARFVAVAAETGDWETAFGLVFSPSISQQAFTLAGEMGFPLDYYDPDTSYEDDVRAFANALDAKVQQLSRFVHAP
ncbi:hypothetical protein [Burkholderia cenocepacia]|uniref:hypothetical protein n=1 Tax=Burkholderia cenocepacia TaxID=95486 RepID=UPI0012370BFB|nr:hypothetical protein [Burkholderia cenocepacia]